MNTKVKNVVLTFLMAAVLFSIAAWAWIKKPNAFSDSERRVLAQFPETTVETILKGSFMKDFETYTLDQFPVRDAFRTVKAVTEFNLFKKSDNNDIYIKDGYVSKLDYPLSYPMLDHAAERFEYIYDTYLAQNGGDVYLSVIPDKNYHMADLAYDYEEMISYIRKGTPFAEYIDITDLLSLEDYYKTDSHWRQECIIDVAARLAAEMGTELSGEYEENILDKPFYGVFYNQSALPLDPETITYLTSDVLDECIVKSLDTGIAADSTVYNMDKAYGKDPYDMFLSGAQALITIENPNADTDKKLMVFRDSFGSSLVPLLVEGYSHITVVDIRYVQSALLGNLIDFEGCDTLFIYSTMMLNSSLALK